MPRPEPEWYADGLVRLVATVTGPRDSCEPTARPEEASDVVREGEPAPDFTLTTDSGEPLTLSDLRGRPVVLYFYPRDDSLAN
jgi:cytochrome oxidase Cu insertion factor (SCO1/SenC/PrrC family)